jgi:hypothetical protein
MNLGNVEVRISILEFEGRANGELKQDGNGQGIFGIRGTDDSAAAEDGRIDDG